MHYSENVSAIIYLDSDFPSFSQSETPTELLLYILLYHPHLLHSLVFFTSLSPMSHALNNIFRLTVRLVNLSVFNLLLDFCVSIIIFFIPKIRFDSFTNMPVPFLQTFTSL